MTGKGINKVQEGIGQTVSTCEVYEADHVKQSARKKPDICVSTDMQEA